MHSSLRISILVAVAVALFQMPAGALAAEGHFDKTLSVSGNVSLDVYTGAGNIKITPGPDNQVHIAGTVRSSKGWGLGGFGKNAESRVNEVVSHPPINQTGNIIRIGKDSREGNNVSIDYVITAPRGASLNAESGSGNLRIVDVGVSAKLSTGSGNTEVSGMRGNTSIEAGSGNITASMGGGGELKAQTGSGNINLQNIDGALQAQTGSGNIDANGKPTSGWKLETGSGNIAVSTGGAAFTLDASSGLGDIRTGGLQISAEAGSNRQTVKGKVRGGGPLVRVETGSGTIEIR